MHTNPIRGGIIRLIYQLLFPLNTLMWINHTKVIPAGFRFLMSARSLFHSLSQKLGNNYCLSKKVATVLQDNGHTLWVFNFGEGGCRNFSEDAVDPWTISSGELCASNLENLISLCKKFYILPSCVLMFSVINYQSHPFV